MKILSIIKLMDDCEEVFVEDCKTFKVLHDGIVENMPDELNNLTIKKLYTFNNVLVIYV